MPTIVIATPHSRYDALEQRLRERLPAVSIVRVRDKEELTQQRLEQIRPELVFLPHWSWLIPPGIHENFVCVIFHMTDLPYGRGGSPLQNLILRGHRETRLTALRCEAALDAGPVYLKRPMSLDGTAEDILRRAAGLIEDMIMEIVQHRPAAVPQQGEVTQFRRRQPADGDLAVVESVNGAYDFIRMLDADSYPPAFIETGHLHIEFSGARMDGQVLEARVRIRGKDQ